MAYSPTERQRPYPGDGHTAGARQALDPNGFEAWTERSRLVLTPIAAPSILGLFGLGAATFLVASNLAGWWGDTLFSPLILAPFVIFFGGLAQLLAAMWAYRARDGVATAMHGTWGAFWLSWGVLMLLAANGALPFASSASEAFGFWWIPLGLITVFGAIAALAENLGLSLTLFLLAAGSGLLAAGLLSGTRALVTAAGWVLVAAAAAAFYTAGAMMLESAFGGRVIMPTGRWSMRGNLPGHRRLRPVAYPGGGPGADVGQ